MSRKDWATFIGVAGAIGLVGGFVLQAMARPYEQTFAPWAVGGIGVALLLIALVLFATAPDEERTDRGWYDDPRDPTRLRYHNGRSWTLRTEPKPSGDQAPLDGSAP